MMRWKKGDVVLEKTRARLSCHSFDFISDFFTAVEWNAINFAKEKIGFDC